MKMNLNSSLFPPVTRLAQSPRSVSLFSLPPLLSTFLLVWSEDHQPYSFINESESVNEPRSYYGARCL